MSREVKPGKHRFLTDGDPLLARYCEIEEMKGACIVCR